MFDPQDDPQEEPRDDPQDMQCSRGSIYTF